MISFPSIHTLKKSAYKKSVNGFIPKSVLIPLRQDMNGECTVLVKPGDTVREGELIACISSDDDKIRSSVYSSIPGKVMGIELCLGPDGKTSRAVRINLSGSFTYLGKKKNPVELTGLSKDSLVEEISKRGVINTFIANEPVLLSDDIINSSKEKIRILAVRLFDEDSSRLTDSLLTKLFFEDILKGSLITARALNAHGIVFVCEKDFVKPDTRNLKIPVIFIQANPKKYPSGYKNQICSAVKLQIHDDIFSKISAKSLFTDSSTMLEVYRTVQFGIPSIDRYVLVSGECINASGLIKVAVGTTLRQLAEQCGGFTKNPGAIFINGYVSGYSTVNLDSPVTKYVKSVTFVPEYRVPDQKMSVCISCGACRRACPEKLSPDIMYREITGGIKAPEIYMKSAKYCTNCVLCNAVCPARLPLSQIIYKYSHEKEVK